MDIMYIFVQILCKWNIHNNKHKYMSKVRISFYLDVRRKKDSGKYPLKLCIFSNSLGNKRRYFNLPYEFDKAEYDEIFNTDNKSRAAKNLRLKLQTIESHANEIAEKLKNFTFEGFERGFTGSGSSKDDSNIVPYYTEIIKQLEKNGQIGTASNYEHSKKSLLTFCGKQELPFYAITPQWLKDYESFMLREEKSLTTVGIYLRPLRAILNSAIAEKRIDPEYYPFGKRKYTIPSPRSVKKAFTKDQLKVLWEAKPLIPEHEKAKAFWFFSYSCNGMNFKDILSLRNKDMQDGRITFRRAKTKNTNKNQAPVVTFLNDNILSTISKYFNEDKSPDSLLFGLIDYNADAKEKDRQLKNFIRYVNQHFRNFAKKAEINEDVSTYWARHSFATMAIQQGASMEFVSEALNHSSIKTTKGYFAGFEDKKKKEISESLMNF